MFDFRISLLAKSRAGLVSVAMASLTLAAATGLAWPQAAKPPPASQADAMPAPEPQAPPEQAPPPSGEPGPPAAAPRAENPGLFNEIGKLFDNRSSIFPTLPTLKSPQEAIDGFNARAKDATDGLSRLTTPLVVRGRMVCPVANGASDCKAASDKLCQTKGFKEGKSLDTDSAQSCSAAALLSGGNRVPGNCQTNYYVTRALCQ